MKILHSLILAGVIVLTGCAATAPNMNLLSVGMTKQEVVDTMGDPLSALPPPAAA